MEFESSSFVFTKKKEKTRYILLMQIYSFWNKK
jgi:hypothetical protein